MVELQAHERENEAGPGVLLGDYREQGRDILLAGRAVRQRWPISANQRKAIAARLYNIAMHEPNSRRAIRAAEVLARLEAQNQSDEHRARAPGNVDTNVVIFLPDNGRGDASKQPVKLEQARRQARTEGDADGS